MIQKLYPGGREKAFSLSYDDGVYQDIRLVDLLNRYGLKGTFNLNTGLMKTEFEWVHESGMPVRRLPEDVVRKLYAGHEVASHTCTHPYMESLSEPEILAQMASDRFFLEKLLGKHVLGFAVPFLYDSPVITRCAAEVGFVYKRISEVSNDYSVPEDLFRWRGSKFHWDEDLEAFVDGFLSTDQELALCQIVGHSYDLDVMDAWERMEGLFAGICEDPKVLPMTNLELAQYTRAMRRAHITEVTVQNPTDQTLWFRHKGKTFPVRPGETVSL